jgi:hypothetical protein
VSSIPEALVRELFPIEGALLISRYREAMAVLGVEVPEGLRLHIDAAGYSPQLAAHLGDPHYLRSGVLHACAVIVSAEQLRVPFVHPSLGFAAQAYAKVTSASAGEIGRITLHEPILGEVRQTSTHLPAAHQLADLSSFELHFRTPGGLVKGVARLEEMKAEFLASSQRWLDDDFIAELTALAREVRHLGALPDGFASSRHSLELFFSQAFGGSYVLEEAGVSAKRATTYILSGQPVEEVSDEHRSARGRRVVVDTLAAAPALAALERHGIARFDARALEREDVLTPLLHWIALDHLLRADPERPLTGRTPREIVELMRREPDPPPDFLEVEDVARRLGDRHGRLDFESLTPLTRLRLLVPASSRGDVRRFVSHLRAFIDPVHLERWWHDAPDVFFGRLHTLSPAQRRYFASWLEGR